MYGKILRGLPALAALMFLASAGWTGWNVVHLLGMGNPMSYAVAGLFDALYLVATAVQHENRFRVNLRRRLLGISWATTGAVSLVNLVSEVTFGAPVGQIVVATLVPLVAKGAIQLNMFTHQVSSDARVKLATRVQSWDDQVVGAEIGEAMNAAWHCVERVRENASAVRIAETERDRVANKALTAPVPALEPVVWVPDGDARPALAPVFVEPLAEPRLPGVSKGASSEAHPLARAGQAVANTAVLTDAELYEVAREVWFGMDRPRSQARFLAALKDAGVKASTERKRAVYDRLSSELISDAVDVVGQDVADSE